MTTWSQIYSAATNDSPVFDENGPADLVMSAEENAMDTTQQGSGEEFDRVALASLEGLLCDTVTTDATKAFFRALGVRW